MEGDGLVAVGIVDGIDHVFQEAEVSHHVSSRFVADGSEATIDFII